MGSSERASMMWHLVCLVLIVSYHRTQASEDSPADFSCTCRHPDDCQPDHRVIEDSPSAASNFCENENFVKCCSVPEDDPEIPKEQTRFETDLITRVMKKIYSMMHPVSEESTEAALSDSQSLQEPENPKPDSKGEEEKVQDTTEMPIEEDLGRNILNSVKDVMSLMEENRYEFPSPNSERQFKEESSFLPAGEAHAIRIKILNHLPSKVTVIPVGFSVPVDGRPKGQLIHHQDITGRPRMMTNGDESKSTGEHEVTQDEADIQKLIDENTSFESRKIFGILGKIPNTRDHRWKVLRKRNNLHRTAGLQQVPKVDEEYVQLSQLIGSFESRKEQDFQQRDSGVNEKIGVPPIAVNPPKKVADLFRHETSLEALLALDRASVQAADGNTLKSPTKLSLPKDADISISYSHQESIENVSRPIRSRPITPKRSPKAVDAMDSEKQSELGKVLIASTENKVGTTENSVNNDLTDALTTIAPVGRFKRPPRILPKRINASGAHNNLDKHRNSRERVHDLFNRSDESKSRASLIIKRRERNLVRFSPNRSGSKSAGDKVLKSGAQESEEIPGTDDSKSRITTENERNLKQTGEADEMALNQTR